MNFSFFFTVRLLGLRTRAPCSGQTEEEVREEELSMCRIRGLTPQPEPSLCHEYLLTSHQMDRLAVFQQCLLRDGCPTSPNIIYNLGDDPSFTMGWSLRHLSIPPYRRNSGAFWVPALRRYVTVKERLASLGWPVCPCLAMASSLPLVCFSDMDLAKVALGNGVCLPNLAVAVLSGLACCRQR